MLNKFAQTEALRVIGFNSAAIGLTAAVVADEEGNNIAYGCHGLHIHNPNDEAIISYSFDGGTEFHEILPNVTHDDPRFFNSLYIKSDVATKKVQGSIGRIQ